MSCDQKVMMLIPPMEKCPMDLYQEVVFYWSNLIPVVAPVTRDKEICKSHVIIRYWCQYLLRRSTQWNPLNVVYLLSKFDVSSFSMTEDIYIYIYIYIQTGNFAAFEHFKIDSYFTDLEEVKIGPACLLLSLGRSQLFYSQ